MYEKGRTRQSLTYALIGRAARLMLLYFKLVIVLFEFYLFLFMPKNK